MLKGLRKYSDTNHIYSKKSYSHYFFIILHIPITFLMHTCISFSVVEYCDVLRRHLSFQYNVKQNECYGYIYLEHQEFAFLIILKTIKELYN